MKLGWKRKLTTKFEEVDQTANSVRPPSAHLVCRPLTGSFQQTGSILGNEMRKTLFASIHDEA